jgi:hypothetical protein
MNHLASKMPLSARSSSLNAVLESSSVIPRYVQCGASKRTHELVLRIFPQLPQIQKSVTWINEFTPVLEVVAR